MLKHMLQHHHRLDELFHALADPTRRAMVDRLITGPISVSELAAPFAMSLSAIGQHVQLLESAGLVRTAKTGRVRRVELVPEALSIAERWFRDHRARWESRLDRLGDLLAEEGDHPSADAGAAGDVGSAAGARREIERSVAADADPTADAGPASHAAPRPAPDADPTSPARGAARTRTRRAPPLSHPPRRPATPEPPRRRR